MDISTKLVHFYGLSINAILSLSARIAQSQSQLQFLQLDQSKSGESGSYFHPNEHIRATDLDGPPETKGISSVSGECLFICFAVGCGSQRVLFGRGAIKIKLNRRTQRISEAIDRPIKPPRH